MRTDIWDMYYDLFRTFKMIGRSRKGWSQITASDRERMFYLWKPSKPTQVGFRKYHEPDEYKPILSTRKRWKRSNTDSHAIYTKRMT